VNRRRNREPVTAIPASKDAVTDHGECLGQHDTWTENKNNALPLRDSTPNRNQPYDAGDFPQLDLISNSTAGGGGCLGSGLENTGVPLFSQNLDCEQHQRVKSLSTAVVVTRRFCTPRMLGYRLMKIPTNGTVGVIL
jgi:hypothetical protein